jgi:glycosyltransferase involved in cell wall biosynthesis
MDKIHIILCTYNRIYNIKKVLDSLNTQTVSSQIVLHILNNNIIQKEEIKQQISTKHNFKIILTHYNNENNIFERFIYASNLVSVSPSLKYLIFIDDDMTYENTWVEDMYNLRKPRHYITWYVKLYNLRDTNIDYSQSSLITYKDSIHNTNKNIRYGNYGGPGGSIIDIDIFKDKEFLNIPTDRIKYMDDIWISYYLSHIKKWKIMRSLLAPNLIPARHHTLYDTKKDEKNAFLKFLIKNGWRY